MLFPFTKSARRKKLLAEPFPEDWLAILHRNVFLYRLLTDAEQARLRDLLRIFIAEKFWEGCRGQEITDEVKVTVAGQACVLLLGFEDYYFDGMKTILVYPGSVLAELGPEGDEETTELLGQAMRGGPVLISWWNARWDSRRLGTENVVLHEFAHVLGFRFNPQEGIPEPDDAARFAPWRRLILDEFRQLREEVHEGRRTLLDPQGIENLAEFFAVATECFFLQAPALREEHPKLYAALAGWYKQDPAGWREPTEAEWAEMDAADHDHDENLIRECTAVLRANPDDVDAYFNRAATFARQGRHAEALADFNTILRLEPDDAEAYCERGAVHLKMGHLDQAVADCSEALRLEPEYADALETRAEAFEARGEAAKAAADRAAAQRLQ
ncbi:hypothetical protein AYO40_04570 [Planctomycetaceae bacterium SCGC AG-212-D15]|nr:hypothetical protein AYO40_04570 [Planctomycetaceae bacterium SCGC AG-212-D15]